MGKLVILCPTVERATYEWKSLLKKWKTIIRKYNKSSLTVELLNGDILYFIGETQGQGALKGLNADRIIHIELFSSLVGAEKEDKE